MASERRRERLKAAWRSHAPIAGLVAAAFLLYAHGLDAPQDAMRDLKAMHPDTASREANPLLWDENYYVRIAHSQAQGQWKDPCWQERPQRADHPVVARYILTASVALFDRGLGRFGSCFYADDRVDHGSPCYTDLAGVDYTVGRDCMDAFTDDLREHGNPWAWRLPSALWATLAVAGVALAGRRLLGSPWAGVLAGGFLAADGLFFVQGRMATLDVFAAGFAALALYAATFATPGGRWSAGILLGLAFSSKYTAFFAGPPILVVALWSLHQAGRLDRRTAAATVGAVALLPGAVWVLSYLPWWVMWIRGHGIGWAAGYWVEMQRWTLAWNQFSPLPAHPARAQPPDWPALRQPLFYFAAAAPGGVIRSIHALPNPIVWWVGAAAGLVALARLAWLQAHGATAGIRRLAAAGAHVLWPGTGLAARGHVAAGNALMVVHAAVVALAAAAHPGFVLAAAATTAIALVSGLPRSVPTTEAGPARPLLAFPGGPAEGAALVAMALPLLAYATSYVLTLQSFLYYFTTGVPFLALALGAAVWSLRTRPRALAAVAGLVFAAFFVPAVGSLRGALPAPGGPYLLLMLAAGVASILALAAWAMPARARAATYASVLVALAAAAFFAWTFPLLAGWPVGDGLRYEAMRTMPWWPT